MHFMRGSGCRFAHVTRVSGLEVCVCHEKFRFEVDPGLERNWVKIKCMSREGLG